MANASVLSILNAVAIRPLPYVHPDELLHLGLGDGRSAKFAVPGVEYERWLKANSTLESAATYHTVRATLEIDGESEEVPGARVGIDLANVLRVSPIMGRFLTADDVTDAAAEAVVIGHTLWMSRFGGDSSTVGRTIQLSERTVTSRFVSAATSHEKSSSWVTPGIL